MSDRPIRVLHIVNRWKGGGVERFIENVISANNDGLIEHELLSLCTPLSTRVACVCHEPLVGGDTFFDMLRAAKILRVFLQVGHFDIVHIHTNNATGFMYANAAKLAGVPTRIIHSHSSRLGEGGWIIKSTVNSLLRTVYGGCETIRLACSTAAGLHLFANRDYVLVRNGIDPRKYAYCDEARREKRKALGIPSNGFVVGCVGMFVPVKNHKRSLEIFQNLLEANSYSYLVLVGDGDLRSQIESEVLIRGLAERVLITGFVEDVNQFYSAFDVMLFPSQYEGFPLALIEAQCNGLPVVASSTITDEVALSRLVHFVSLEEENDIWVSALVEADRMAPNDAVSIASAHGFTISETTQALNVIYKSGENSECPAYQSGHPSIDCQFKRKG